MHRRFRGPLRVLVQLIERYFKDGVSHAAAELAFFLLFSIFPLLMVLNSLLGMANFSEVTILDATRFLPDDVQDIVLGYLNYLGSKDAVQPLMVGSALTLYFLSRAVRSIIYSMRRIYRNEPHRGSVGTVMISLILTAGLLLLMGMSILLIVVGQRFLEIITRWFRNEPHRGSVGTVMISLILTAGLLLLMGMSILLIVVGQRFLEIITRWFPMLEAGATRLHYLSYPVAIVIALGFLIVLYSLVPPVHIRRLHYLSYPVAIVIALGFLIVLYSLVPPVHIRWRDALPGAGVSLVGWVVLTRCFAYYVDNMGRYSILYGSIGAIIVLMLWLYLTSTTLILGGVLNWTIWVVTAFCTARSVRLSYSCSGCI